MIALCARASKRDNNKKREYEESKSEKTMVFGATCIVDLVCSLM